MQVRLAETECAYLGIKETSYCQLRTQVCVSLVLWCLLRTVSC